MNSIKSHNNYLFAATQIGVFRSDDDGKNWVSVNNGLDDSFVFSLEASGNNIFAGTQYRGIYISSDNGMNWKEANNGYTSNRNVWTLMNDKGSIYAGLDFGLFVTNDNGIIWYTLGLPQSDIGSIAKTEFFLVAGGYTIFISEDNGITWEIKSNGLPMDDITDVAICDSLIFVLTTNYGLYTSIDSGNNWEPNTAFNISSSNTIFVKDSLVFVGTSFSGIYFSSDRGLTWNDISDGLPFKSVYSLEIKDDYIYAGTYQGGVWKRRLSEIVGIKEKFSLTEVNIYPNPIVNQLIIELPLYNNVRIDILNIDGILIKSSVLQASKTEFALGKLAKGVYILKATSRKEVLIKKFIIN